MDYTRYPTVLEGYSDANWISDMKDTKSTSDYVFTLGRAAVCWKSLKKTCIARSIMESEFIALDKAGEEAECLSQFLEDIPIWPKPVPTIVYIVIANLQLVGRRMTCITVSLDIYVVDIIPLGNCSQMGLFLLII